MRGIVAKPVASFDTERDLADVANEVVCVVTPSPLPAIGLFP